MGLGGVAIAVLPYVIHPKTAVLGRAGGGTGGRLEGELEGDWRGNWRGDKKKGGKPQSLRLTSLHL